MKNKYITREIVDSVSILLASSSIYQAYEIRNVMLQLNSIDDTLTVLNESLKHCLSLDEAVYLKIKGRDEK